MSQLSHGCVHQTYSSFCENLSAHQRNGKNATKIIYTASDTHWRRILGQMNMKMFPRIKKQR